LNGDGEKYIDDVKATVKRIPNAPKYIIDNPGPAATVALLGVLVGMTTTAKLIDEAPSNAGAYVKSNSPAVQRTLPKDKNGILQPDVDVPHTQLGQSTKSHGAEPQAREWMYDDKGRLVPSRDIDFTDHNKPSIHPNPHQQTRTTLLEEDSIGETRSP
jgi:uncharacterized protein